LEVVVSLTYGRTRPVTLGHQERSSAQWQAWIGMISFDTRQWCIGNLPKKTENVFGKQELLDLAAVCEEVANGIEDRLTGG
jgi:hypothetical protein